MPLNLLFIYTNPQPVTRASRENIFPKELRKQQVLVET